MKEKLTRIRPYFRSDTVVLLERLREVTGISLGNLLLALLVESNTFTELSKNTDATDEELEKIFRGLPFIDEMK